LTEQNSAWGVHDWPALPGENASLFSAIANPGKDPECQNSSLLLLRADTKELLRSSGRVRAMLPVIVEKNWATMRRFNSACNSTAKN
jgi:hypothetical protein